MLTGLEKGIADAGRSAEEVDREPLVSMVREINRTVVGDLRKICADPDSLTPGAEIQASFDASGVGCPRFPPR